VAGQAERLGLRVRDAAVDLVLAHLQPQWSALEAPTHEPQWQPPAEPLGVTAARDTLTVADFFDCFAALGGDDWPRSGNRTSIRTSAERLTVIWALMREWRAGTFALDVDATARIRARVARAVGDLYFRTKIQVTEVDSTTAEATFASRSDAFVMPESASISAIGVATREQAAAVHDWLKTGMSFGDAAEKARASGFAVVYAPSTPLFPRGAFPDSDERIFALDPGEFTEPIAQRDGYQIYFLLQKRPPRRFHRVELSLDDVKRQARDVLSHDALEVALAKLGREFPVEIHHDEVDRSVGSVSND
jgi:hypothetical protein